jgi:transketolase
MRKTCLNMVHELARRDERVFFVGSDLGYGVLKEFRQEFPERFFMEGISEANVVGLAAGLAMDGKIPFVNTIATFITRRALEQLVVDVCMHNVPVRLIGNGGGLVYAPLGSTHIAFDDIGLLRTIPNMCIIAPADAEEMRRLMPQTLDWPGPIYIRLAKGYDPIITRDNGEFVIGKAIQMAEGEDVLLACTGVTLGPALAASRMLVDVGLSAMVLHVPTIKPLDVDALCQAMDHVRAVVVLEEHSVIGGLGDALASLAIERPRPPRFRKIGLPDCFPDIYGSQAEQMERFGITSENAVATARALLR